MNIHADTAKRFDTFRRIAVSSLAAPSWFATPVDAREDDDSLTLTFHSPPDRDCVWIDARERSLTVLDERRAGSLPRAMRVCALPCSIETQRIRKDCSGELFTIRLLKKRAARDDAKPFSAPQ